MKQIYQFCNTEEQAKQTVKFLMEDGISAYRQGKVVYIDDGQEDLGL